LRSPEEIHRILHHEPKVVPEMTTQTVPQGWYHDSGDPGIVRWWDGTRWTSLTKRTSAAAPPPPPPPPQQVPAIEVDKAVDTDGASEDVDDFQRLMAEILSGKPVVAEPEPPAFHSDPATVLNDHLPELLDAYERTRVSNTPLDALFAAFDEAIPEEDLEAVRDFALGEADDVYGAEAGYRATMPLLRSFEGLTGHAEMPKARMARWLGMNIVDLAEELGSDPVLTDLFLWTMHHDMDDDTAAIITDTAEFLVGNANGARTRTGRKIKRDQADHVLRLLARKAHGSGTEHQEMWCTALANVLASAGEATAR
jgi:hypothetical protein